MLKERLRYVPDTVHAIDDVMPTPTSTGAMDTTTADIDRTILFRISKGTRCNLLWVSDPG